VNTPTRPVVNNSEDPATYPLDELDISLPQRFQDNSFWPFFERMRKEDPVHYCKESAFGPFWSVTRFKDIMAVDMDHETFSSEPAILLGDQPEDFEFVNFIALDPPLHDVHRAAVTGVVAPRNLADLESVIRDRAGQILDSLPIGETFNWVDRVSIELTTQMLATIFDFPFEDRSKLTHWSDVSIATPEITGGTDITEEYRREQMEECIAYFARLWEERAGQPQKFDFLSMLAHNENTNTMVERPMEFLGTLMLLIVGGNDTTRNSISGGVVALNENPEQYAKLRAQPELIPNMVSEIIRWQTPLMHMRRTATKDVEFGGKQIKKGDKVVMWYVSGNRDETMIEDPNEFLIDRERARQHLSFGFGVHRCMGNRLAEMQLRVLWEEIMARFERVEMVSEPVRVRSNFVRGYSDLQVRLHPRKA